MSRTYQETIDFLYQRLPLFSRIGAAAYKADLSNTIRLCELVGNPHRHFKSVHIAGTNGKGSVSHMLAAVLQAAGYKTGLYTSPHLKDFRERIKINGQMVSEDFVVTFTEKLAKEIEDIEPSFFEMTVAMAFQYFSEQEVDIAIIETGLGGRLDSTNVINPEVSVITNIGMDHTDLLGDTLEKIAREKAGIIKKNIPVVIGEVVPETRNVFEYVSYALQSPLVPAQEARPVTNWHYSLQGLDIETGIPHEVDHEVFHLDLNGIYQVRNLPIVLATIDELRKKGWKIDSEKIHEGLRHVKRMTGFRGRWDIVQHKPLIVLDVAHNKDGILQLLQQIEITDHDGLHIILGLVKDKDVNGILKLLPKHAKYYFTNAQIARAMPAQDLAAIGNSVGLEGNHYENVHIAVQSATASAKKSDLIVICGSVFLVGETNYI